MKTHEYEIKANSVDSALSILYSRLEKEYSQFQIRVQLRSVEMINGEFQQFTYIFDAFVISYDLND